MIPLTVFSRRMTMPLERAGFIDRFGCLVMSLAVMSALLSSAPPMYAQETGAGRAVSPALALQIDRARLLVERGEGIQARAVLDSLVSGAPLASFDLAEALYWRAVLAERISDAEQDWKRLVIEEPLSPRTPEALLRLGELDMLRGRPSEARQYFERVVREYPDSARVARGTIWLVRSYFDERDMSRGCQVLGSLPVGQVPDGELQLQVNELRRRCTSVVTASTAAAPAARRQTDGDKAANSAPSRTAGRFSVQLAAFNTRREADAAVARFKRVGVDTRVDGTSRPFRIRTGRYGTRAEAAEVLATLRKQGHRGFVVEITP